MDKSEIRDTLEELIGDEHSHDLDVTVLSQRHENGNGYHENGNGYHENGNGYHVHPGLADDRPGPSFPATDDDDEEQPHRSVGISPQLYFCTTQPSGLAYKLRQVCIQLDSSFAWSFLVFSMSMLDCLGVTIMAELYTGDYRNSAVFHSLYIFDDLCVGIQGIEVFVGIYAKGFKTWIKDVYNKLELSLLSTALLGFCLTSLGWRSLFVECFLTDLPHRWKVFVLRSFRLLRLFKLLSRFQALSYVKHIVTTLEVAMVQMFTVCSILFFFMLTYR